MDPISTNTTIIIITGMLLSFFFLPLGFYFILNKNPTAIVAGTTTGLITSALIYIGYTNSLLNISETKININKNKEIFNKNKELINNSDNTNTNINNEINNTNKNKVVNN